MNMYEWIESLDKDMISIVIPTFNRPIFLGTALQSLVEQINPPKFEVIVVDDGSTIENYGANEIICEHYFNYLDLRLIGLSKNSGTVSIPRNIGISHINGRTIAPMDDDCLAKPNKLRVLFDEINKLKMMWVPFVFGNREECRIVNGLLQVIRTPDSGSHMPKDVGLDNGQFIYRSDVYNSIKPSLAINACDWELYKQIADFGYFQFVDEIVCSYIWHDTNISYTPKPQRVNPALIINDFKQYFKDGPFKDAIYNKIGS